MAVGFAPIGSVAEGETPYATFLPLPPAPPAPLTVTFGPQTGPVVNGTTISAQLNALYATVQSTYNAIPSLQNATAVQVIPLHNAVHALYVAVLAAIAKYDADIATTTLAGMIPNVAAPQLWPILQDQENSSVQIAALLNLRGYVGRLERNLHSILGPDLSNGLPGVSAGLQ